MASRVGTYLSDENIKRMCPLEHMPPGSKTYELFKIASSPDKLAQRPQDPKEALRAISKLQNQSYQDLEKRYIQSLSIIKPELIGVIASVPKPNQASSIQSSVSRPTLVPMGTSASTSMPPSFTQELAQYEPLSLSVQKQIFKELFNQAQALGLPTGNIRASDIDISMSRSRRTDTFKRLVESVQQGSTDPDFTANIMGSVLSGVGGSTPPMP
jgi:hypothetical protein